VAGLGDKASNPESYLTRGIRRLLAAGVDLVERQWLSLVDQLLDSRKRIYISPCAKLRMLSPSNTRILPAIVAPNPIMLSDDWVNTLGSCAYLMFVVGPGRNAKTERSRTTRPIAT
jgi:hypothetical protein